jgi:hypothetical protein
MDADETRARAAILHTLSTYTRHVDSGRAVELSQLFTVDTRYDMGGDVVAEGRDQIPGKVEELKAVFAGAESFGRIRHHTSSVFVEVESDDRARAVSYFAAFSSQGPDHWGVYRDTLVRDGERWLFASRTVVLEGAAPTSPVRGMLPAVP